MAKSKGRTSRPQRTSRTTAKPESTTDDAAVVEETDVEVTETDATGGTETVEVTEIEVTETDADEDTDAEETDADDDAAASAKDEKKSESTAKDSKDRVSKDKDSKDAKADSAKTKDSKGGKKAATKRTSRSGNPAKRSQGRKTASYTSEAGQQTIKPNPRWFLPVLIGLLLVGLIWLVTFYITQGAFPVEAWGNWNILIGFAFFVAGLIMSTRWR
ncbi:cell division protein CrgA [Brevibacterium casei]|uniref:Cell division protein CrgA n=1 Tax=Brevibacterium casei CIP 102111 TaxID=1255625 RepID=A0A2H1J9M9_9MICO|nr:cell division protein CrgA [Brevibacterium casei]MBE4693201.1 cell division protein CrgA [Brevibacterium casei]MBY3576324.1 cell division protein CrgA [Brevibacterium casei]MCT2182058.1 cell division protein CrgA [Brevibacterium casei]QPR38880.1 cell division protein CrgA [Brevibacterium casei]QPR43046.1 cell division protein CrgA [Brevibacterium casei]